MGRLTKRQLEARGLAVPEPYYRLPPGMTFDFLPLDSLEFYQLSFRIVRLERDDGTMISFLTNLPQDEFPLSELKQLYSRRWGVETSFRSLKYTVDLIHLHAKKPDFVLQEIFAAFLIFNFAQASLWTDDASCGVSQYQRHVNFSDTVYACCQATVVYESQVEKLGESDLQAALSGNLDSQSSYSQTVPR